MDVQSYIQTLEEEFKRHQNESISIKQKAYMKNHFEFYGIKSPVRREIQKPFLTNKHLPAKEDLIEIVTFCWNKPYRSFHYFAQELAFKYQKNQSQRDIYLYEFMITNNSWWDTVDYIAPKLIGNYFLTFPAERDGWIKKWLATDNLWLHRTCILFQLKYKDKLDLEFLSYVIQSLLGSKEFFINKAIGWILREISRTKPEWVLDFVEKNTLSKLSNREAIRLIKNP